MNWPMLLLLLTVVVVSSCLAYTALTREWTSK
jgi:hypothetical protein